MIFTHPGFQLAQAIRATAIENVSVVPADLAFDGDAVERSIATLRRQLRVPAIEECFDLVILDTPPSLDMVLVNALAAADAALVPMIPHALSAEGIRQFTRVFFRVATTINSGLKLLGVLPVMVNARAVHHRCVLRDIETDFGASRLLEGIRTDILLAEAFAARLPIRSFAPRSRGAEDYRSLAAVLGETWALPQAAPCFETKILEEV
jgi:chromosome partitioning protein